MPRPVLMLMAFVLFSSSAWGLTYSGKVADSATEEGLLGAEITSLSGEKTKTDASGLFQLECQNPQVQILLPGYQEKTAKLASGINAIVLEVKGLYEIRTVQVKAKPEAKKVVVSKQNVNREAAAKTTVAIFPDVSRVVQMLPGVTSSGDMSALLYVRGGEPDEVVATLDDMILMNPYLWGGRLSVFNPNLVESVDFYAGGFPAESNQAMSGFLVVKNRTGNPDRLAGLVDLSAATADVVLEGPCLGPQGSSFLFGFRRTYYDLAVNATSNQGSMVFPYFYDGQAKLSFPLSQGVFTVQSLFSLEGMDVKMGETEDAGYGSGQDKDARFKYLYRKHNSSFGYTHHLTPKIDVLTLLGVRNEIMDFSATDRLNPMTLSGNQCYPQLRHIWQILTGDRHIVKTGLYAITGTGTIDLDITTKVPTLNGYYVDTIQETWKVNWPLFYGAFLQDDIEVLEDTLYVNPGVNYQFSTMNHQDILNPRLAMKYKFTPTYELHLATGLYSQHPFEYSLLDETHGNPHLQAQESWHYILGTKLDFKDDWSLQVEGYYKDYRKLFVSDPDPAVNYTNHGTGYAYGADLILQKKIGGSWDGWITYSYLAARRKITDRSDPLNFGQNPNLEPVDAWYRANSDRPHTFNLVLNYKISQAWKIALTQKYMTGKPATPVVGADYVAAIDEYVPRYGEYNSERLPDYASTDIKVSMPFFGLKGWGAYVQVSNLFDVKNVDSYEYKKDFSEKRAIYQLPRMIIGGIRWEF